MCCRQAGGACTQAWAGVRLEVPSEKDAVSWSEAQVHDQGAPLLEARTLNQQPSVRHHGAAVDGCRLGTVQIGLAVIGVRGVRGRLAGGVAGRRDDGGRFAACDRVRAGGVVGGGGDVEHEQGLAGAAVASGATPAGRFAVCVPALH